MKLLSLLFATVMLIMMSASNIEAVQPSRFVGTSGGTWCKLYLKSTR